MSTPENYSDRWLEETSAFFKEISPNTSITDITKTAVGFVNGRRDLVANQEISSFNATRENEFKLNLIDNALNEINTPLNNEIRQRVSDKLLLNNTDFNEWLQTRNPQPCNFPL